MTLVTGLLQRLDLAGHERLHEVLVTPSYPTSRHVVSLLLSDRRGLELVVKTPRIEGDDQGVRREAALLERLAGNVPDGLVIPRVVATPRVGESFALVETAVPGASLGPHRVRRSPAAAVATGELAARCLPAAGPLTETCWEGLLAPVRLVCDQLPDGSALGAATERSAQALLEAGLPAVVEHGDMSHPNVLLPGPGRVGLVDWERAVWQGVPGHDLVQFLSYVARARSDAATVQESVRAFEQAFLGRQAWAREALERHLQLRGVSPALVPHLLVVSWARAAGTYVERLDLSGAGAGTALPAQEPDTELWRRCVAATADSS